jgi:hypothetical protein
VNNYENKNVVDAAVKLVRNIQNSSWTREQQITNAMTPTQVKLMNKLIDEINESGL